MKNKTEKTKEVGFQSIEHKLKEDVSEAKLLSLVDQLNKDDNIQGTLVQLPLPKHINSDKVLDSILPVKDVDGFHPINVGNLSSGNDAMVPCTPLGCYYLIKKVIPNLSGLNAVVIGRSNINGKPMAQLLLKENCTVTIVHSKTKNIEEICKNGDIIIAAVGKAKMVKSDWVKDTAIIIDVGINRIEING